MNEITNLNYDFNGHHLRVFGTYEEPWFLANDVCKVLEIANPRHAVSRLDDDEKGVAIVNTPITNQYGGGGVVNDDAPSSGEPPRDFGTFAQEMTTINEFGLYNLTLTSRTAESKAFKRWVTHEVLPSIRKTGGYIHDADLFMTHQTLRDLDFRSMERTDNWCVEMLKYHLGPHMVEWFAKSHPREKQWLSGEFMAEAKKFLATFLPDGEGGLRRFPKAWRKGRASVFIDSAMSIEEGVHDYWMQYKHAGSNRPTLEDHLLKVCYCPREGTRPVDVQHLRDMQSTPEGCQQ